MKRRLCRTHYDRWRRYGSPLGKPADHRSPTRMTPEERFFSYAAQEGEHWMWTGPTLGREVCNYGRLFMGDDAKPRLAQAHRWSYEFFIGEIPDDLEPDHTCEITLCVNPWHLDLVPHGINVKRGKRWPGPSAGRKPRTPAERQEAETLRPDCPKCGTLYVTQANGKRRCPLCFNERQRDWTRRTGRVTGEGTGVRQRERTHCANNHEYTPENTYISPRGTRDCKICRKERNRASRERNRKPVQPVTQCVNGHEYTPENTFVRANGKRACRACMKIRRKEGMQRKRIKRLNSGEPSKRQLCPIDCTCGRHTRSGPRKRESAQP